MSAVWPVQLTSGRSIRMVPRHHLLDVAGRAGGLPPGVLLVVVAGGLAIWALGRNPDLDDQRDQTAQAQQQAAQASREVETLSGEIDQISQDGDRCGRSALAGGC
jgi:hypothetical protein